MPTKKRSDGPTLQLILDEVRSHGEQLRSLDEQTRSHGDELRSHGEQLRTLDERVRAQGVEIRGHSVLLEDMRSQNRLTIEAVETTRLALTERIDRLDEDTRGRDAVLELAIRELRATVQENTTSGPWPTSPRYRRISRSASPPSSGARADQRPDYPRRR